MVVVMAEFPTAVLLIRRRGVLNSFGRTVFRYKLFDMMCCAMFGNHQEVVFVALVRNARHCTHFGITQLALGKPLIHLRQLCQRVCNSYFFTSSVHADATFEIEPVGAGVKTQFSESGEWVSERLLTVAVCTGPSAEFQYTGYLYSIRLSH